MKKILLTLIMFLILSIPAYAIDLGITDANIPPININGDTLYLPQQGKIAVGIGYRVATLFKDMVEIRAEVVSPVKDLLNADVMAGAGVGINIPEVVKKLGGNWVLKGLNPSIGILALFDMTNQQTIVPAVYLTLIHAEF